MEDKKEEEKKTTVEEEKVVTEEKSTEKVQEEPKEEKKGFFKKKENPEVEKLKEENALLKDKVLRTTAEMQNMRRRMEEEKTNLLKFEGEGLIKNLLPVVDNFERAIAMDDANLADDLSKFLSGFKMIYGNLLGTLKNYEIAEIEVLNKPFDPNLMEAVMADEIEGIEPNIVIDVLQKGYTYKGKVIRHAMVKVSK